MNSTLAGAITAVMPLMLAGVVISGAGQDGTGQPSTPSACLKAARDFQTATMKQVGLPMTGEKYQAVQQEKTKFARGCVARIAVDDVSGPELSALAELYVEAGQPELAGKTVEKAVGANGTNPAARAATLLAAARITMRQAKSDARNAQVERYVERLDGLDESFVREKIEGHGVLNNYYRADDIDKGIIEHSRRILQLNASLTPDQRRPLARTLVAAYSNLAEALAGQEQTPEAVQVLRRAPTDLAGLDGAEAQLKSTLDRYLLVGRHAAPIAAPRWLNAEPAGGKMDLTDGVTWLQFTAHWCGPCRESYPGIVRLQQRFGSRGFRVVMATQLYGFFESKRGLGAEQELGIIRDYFPKHGITFPVAVADQAAAGSQARPVNEENYRVGGIPQIQIIDRKGVIHLIMVGYDEANEERLAALIDRLLDGPAK